MDSEENWNWNWSQVISRRYIIAKTVSVGVKRTSSEGPFYSPSCRHSNRVESAYSAVSVNLVIDLAGNEFRLIKSAKRAVCDTFPNR